MGDKSDKSNFDSDNGSSKGKTGLQKGADESEDDDINTLNNLVGIGNYDPYKKGNNADGNTYPPIDTPNTNSSV